MDAADTIAPTRMHRAARVEDAVRGLLNRALRRRGWRPRVIAYTGYGSTQPRPPGATAVGDAATDASREGRGWVRVFARVVLAPPTARRRDVAGARGWRRFFTAAAADVAVQVAVGSETQEVTTERGGYIDLVLPSDLAAGWGEVLLTVEGEPPAQAPVHVVGPGTSLGIVSDIDDTVMVTALPRPLVALWNTAVRRETAREPVPGMAALYRELLDAHPDAFILYLSTGAWNVAPALDAFLKRHDYPRGPLLLTDWGPTPDGWFRSGQLHKRTQLRRLLGELPHVPWMLIGDDGQHDPDLYAEVVAATPERVRAVLIRQLTAVEQVLTHGTTEPPTERHGPTERPAHQDLRAPDGAGLRAALQANGLLPVG